MTLQLTGGAFAGTFFSAGRSGVQVIYDDSVPPVLISAAPAVPVEWPADEALPTMAFTMGDESPFFFETKSGVSWGDGTATQADLSSFQVFWTPFAATAATVSGGVYESVGRFSPVLQLVDLVGNTAQVPLGDIWIVRRPRLRGRISVGGVPRVGRTLTCRASFSGGRSRVLYVWYRDGRIAYRSGSGRYRVVRGDRAHRIACRAFASNVAGRSGAIIAPPSVLIK